MSLEAKIDLLESYIPRAEILNKSVSGQTVGWHVHHSFKVIHSVLKALEKSDPARYKWKFNFYRAVFMTLGWFPRGTAKAPRISRPPEEVDLEEMKEELSSVRQLLDTLNHRTPNSYFRHPYFGKMNTKEAKNFLKVHSDHHLKIIKDILR